MAEVFRDNEGVPVKQWKAFPCLPPDLGPAGQRANVWKRYHWKPGEVTMSVTSNLVIAG
jgi:hypothetical protein